MKKSFGEKLTEARGIKKRAEIARLFGVSLTAYSNWERDDKEPNFETLRSICHHFNVSADWLLGLEADGRAAITATNSAVALHNSTANNETGKSFSQIADTVVSQQQTISRLAGIIENLTKERIK
jgi:transcriptional regulator with XRE-family HTH domain